MKMNLFKIITTLIIIVSITSCKKDPCKDVICEPGTECDGVGNCLALTDQEINVYAEFEIFDSYKVGNRINVTVDALSELKSASIVFPNGESFSGDYLLRDSVNFSTSSGAFPGVDYVLSEEFMGEININLGFNDINLSKTDLTFDFNIDTINTPVINTTKVNQELKVSWSDVYNEEYTIVTVYDENVDIILYEEKVTNASEITISSTSTGWVSPYTGFEASEYYRVYVKSYITNETKVDNINYSFVSYSSESEQFEW